MELKYIVKVKDSYNPPEFKVGMGKGVLWTQEVDYKKIKTNEDLNSPTFQCEALSFSRELLEEIFEVKIEIIDIKKRRKEKLKQIEENEKKGQ